MTRFKRMPVFDGLDESLREEILGFLELCDDLKVLIEKENEILLCERIITDIDAIDLKAEMLDQLDSMSLSIFPKIYEEAYDNFVLYSEIIRKIRDLQRALDINTELCLHTMAAFGPLQGRSEQVTCH